jgi:hypothetical protein
VASETSPEQPVAEALAAASMAPTHEGRRQFPSAETVGAFSVPISVAAESHHEQEDYLWGV